MQELLTTLNNTLAELPDMAMWFLIAILIYKLIVYALGYGALFYAIKTVAVLITRALSRVANVDCDRTDFEREFRWSAMSQENLADVIASIKGVRSGSRDYVHDSDIEWLKDAINEKKNSNNQ